MIEGVRRLRHDLGFAERVRISRMPHRLILHPHRILLNSKQQDKNKATHMAFDVYR